MPTDQPNGAKRLTPEQRQAIPLLYAALGSKQRVADRLGCKIESVDRWLDNISGEEWDRILEKQRESVGRRAVEIVFEILELVPGKLPDATLRDLMGAIKILSEGAINLGVWKKNGNGPAGTGGLEEFLAQAEAERKKKLLEAQTKAMREAARTGSVEPLRVLLAELDSNVSAS